MIATAAEANPTCFSASPLVDLEQTFIPSYIRVVSNPSNIRWCKGSNFWIRLDILTITGPSRNFALQGSEVRMMKVQKRRQMPFERPLSQRKDMMTFKKWSVPGRVRPNFKRLSMPLSLETDDARQSLPYLWCLER